jgi:hypothetical protein
LIPEEARDNKVYAHSNALRFLDMTKPPLERSSRRQFQTNLLVQSSHRGIPRPDEIIVGLSWSVVWHPEATLCSEEYLRRFDNVPGFRGEQGVGIRLHRMQAGPN